MSFSKSWNCTSRFGESNFAFWKTHKCKLVPNWTRKTVWLLINNINMKKFAWRKCRKIFLEAIVFSFKKSFFTVSALKFRCQSLCDIIRSENFLISFRKSQYRISMCNCTGVKLFTLVLHVLHWCYAWTALCSANQNQVIFSCILLGKLSVSSSLFRCNNVWIR